VPFPAGGPLQLLRVLGARKFVVANVGPIGCAPTFAPGLGGAARVQLPGQQLRVQLQRGAGGGPEQPEEDALFLGATIVTFDTYEYTMMLRAYPDTAGESGVIAGVPPGVPQGDVPDPQEEGRLAVGQCQCPLGAANVL